MESAFAEPCGGGGAGRAGAGHNEVDDGGRLHGGSLSRGGRGAGSVRGFDVSAVERAYALAL